MRARFRARCPRRAAAAAAAAVASLTVTFAGRGAALWPVRRLLARPGVYLSSVFCLPSTRPPPCPPLPGCPVHVCARTSLVSCPPHRRTALSNPTNAPARCTVGRPASMRVGMFGGGVVGGGVFEVVKKCTANGKFAGPLATAHSLVPGPLVPGARQVSVCSVC